MPLLTHCVTCAACRFQTADSIACPAQGKNQGYAAIHGCTGDIVKFNMNPNEQHNLVLVNNANSARPRPTLTLASALTLHLTLYQCADSALMS